MEIHPSHPWECSGACKRKWVDWCLAEGRGWKSIHCRLLIFEWVAWALARDTEVQLLSDVFTPCNWRAEELGVREQSPGPNQPLIVIASLFVSFNRLGGRKAACTMCCCHRQCVVMHWECNHSSQCSKMSTKHFRTAFSRWICLRVNWRRRAREIGWWYQSLHPYKCC